jgi:hypothetical protein
MPKMEKLAASRRSGAQQGAARPGHGAGWGWVASPEVPEGDGLRKDGLEGMVGFIEGAATHFRLTSLIRGRPSGK